MKKWRLDILIELYDLPDDAFILVCEPTEDQADTPENKPSAGIVYHGAARGDLIPWQRFCELRDNGDIERAPDKGKTTDHTIYHYYRIAQGGKSALQSLPNFYRRAERQRKVMA